MPRLLESTLIVLVSAALAIGAAVLLVDVLRKLMGPIVVSLGSV